jgi:chorismate dehydratase
MMRLGSIAFVNSLPVEWGLRSGAVTADAELVRGTPAELNGRILTKGLEVSPVSALWYAEHQRELLLLSGLSISSESSVESVLLFSKRPLAGLSGKKIAVTDQGRTTPALLEILCRLRYGFEPVCHSREGVEGDDLEGADALLLIGDEALLAKERLKRSGLHIIDLAEEWRAWTGLPIVFAVWAVRRDIFAAQAEAVVKLRAALLASKRWGLSHREDVFAAAQLESGLSKSILENYFPRLSYDLNDTLKEGMRLYFEYAARCGLLGAVGELEEVMDDKLIPSPLWGEG